MTFEPLSSDFYGFEAALTDQEKAAARLTLILQGFKPAIDAATLGTGDFAQKQDELGAKFETVMGKIGAGVEGPLADLLTFINDEIDAIPAAIEGFDMFGRVVAQTLRNITAPLAGAADAMRNLLGLAGDIGRININDVGNFISGGRSDRDIAASIAREQQRNGLGR